MAEVPGEATQTGTALLEKATAVLEGFGPINSIHQHLCAFHFYGDNMARQVQAHHYCSHPSEDMRQCLIYDSPDADARLIGVEYIISESLFLTLPDQEKKLWHSHEYEVKSGTLFMPGVPGPLQHREMEKLCKSYGKAIHFWQIDKGDSLPLGPPSLMYALTTDGQLDTQLAREAEKRFGINLEEERKKREYMKGPDHGIHPLANGWSSGKGLKFKLRETECLPSPSATGITRVFV
ncbi:oil body-associated protein 1A isoform X2 [Amborella trichopoda]|uniref:oil body-associated protein 1A isoform X2 n=1 Tax=Amborella trichopoda TaxID=13333 RepID=UPI0005D2EA8E|nr:oil body-associated protein 1A isoform X2 [Amborella trichopoda]|eukprot:XP_006858585.2 oil body-associated protein 1A isoform X2 [Amborella trichopoda]